MTTTTHYIPLLNVDSDHCAIIVEKAIAKTGGVLKQRVELNNQRAVVELSSPEVLTEVVRNIRNIGYEVRSVKQNFPVLEMTCASCASGVENVLVNQTGVLKASVNYANNSAAVEYFPEFIHTRAMKKALQGAGYDLVLEEQEEVDLEHLQQNKFRKLRVKTYLALALSAPVVVVGMFFMNMPWANEIMFVLSTPVLFYFGRDFYLQAYKQAKHRSANMDTLVALSTGVAYIFSVFNMLFPEVWKQRGLEAHVYFEAAAVIIAFILLGKLLEEKAKGNTSTAIKKLMGLQPKTVVRINENGESQSIPISEVVVGDFILAKPGDKIAVDGTLVFGESYVDESMLSGEPLPVLKVAQSKVFAGTINQKGSFQFRADKVGSDTMLAQIIKTVQDAQGSKAPVQKLVDKVAGIFVPIVIVIALVAFTAWNIFGGENAFTYGLLALITVLVIACPCALGLATPTAIMVGVGKGAEMGILIKDAESLERAKKINAVVLDKTGTITEGKPKVTKTWWINSEEIWPQVLLGIESQSEHPLAQAIIDHLPHVKSHTLDEFQSVTGQGAIGLVGEEKYFVGNKRLLEENNIPIKQNEMDLADAWSKEGNTLVWYAKEDAVLGVFAIADQIKATSFEAIQSLQKQGIEVFMLTGDNRHTAKSVAEKVGISTYIAEVMPEEKLAFVKELQAKNKVVAMVGDGINDSSALAQADLSIAMGRGSDIAMDVAKMTLISSDLNKISEAIQLSKMTLSTLRQNLFWAFIYNLVGIPIAAGILYPINGFLLNPMLAGAAMAMSSVSVVSNSLRLKYK